MRSVAVTILSIVALASAMVVSATPARAIDAELAKQCRAMMIKAHPTETYGPTKSAELQRDYFKQCIANNGKMDDAKPAAGTPKR